MESGAREETGRFRDVKRCVATEDRTRVSGIALMHVTSWSESYPLRNSLMGVRGFRPVVSSCTCFSFVLKRPALLACERQSQGMRSFSPPKTTSAGRLFEGETYRRFNKSRSPVEEDFVDEESPTFKLSRGTSKFVLHRHRAFFGATTIEEVMAT